MGELKQVIVVRSDLGLSKGKLAAQVAHASLDSYKKAKKSLAEEWESSGAKKVVLKVESLSELDSVFSQARVAKLPASRITDAGHTELPPGTTTCVGIGPSDEAEIDRITGHLKML